MKPPAFQFYTDDFLGGVATMSQAEVGAYILLLCQQWNHGSIPVQPDRQQNVAKGAVSDHVISKFKRGEDGELRNERLEMERQKQAIYREKQRQKGLASGIARASSSREPRLNSGSTTVQPSGQPKGNSPSPSPSPSTKLTTKGGKALTGGIKELADRIEKALGLQWVNDAGKWINRIKYETDKARRVVAEVESAIKEKRIEETVAQYAEQQWKDFK
jgi:uncharacterized protein YdaU (DUF1376 family)